MTIAVAITLSEGIVFGADSAITVQGAVKTRVTNVEGVLKIYNDAEKLFRFGDLPVGLVTFGLGTLDQRSMASYVREFELNQLPKRAKKDTTIEKLSQDFYDFMRTKYVPFVAKAFQAEQNKKLSDVPVEKRPALGFFIGGYSPGEHLPELYQVMVQFDDKAKGVTQRRARGNFGGDWAGHHDGVNRFMKGFDQRLTNELVGFFVQKKGVALTDDDKKALRELLHPYEYVIPFDAMPLQEGVDYANFLISIMVNQTRFVVGALDCGGKVRMAVVRPAGFERVSYPQLELRP